MRRRGLWCFSFGLGMGMGMAREEVAGSQEYSSTYGELERVRPNAEMGGRFLCGRSGWEREMVGR